MKATLRALACRVLGLVPQETYRGVVRRKDEQIEELSGRVRTLEKERRTVGYWADRRKWS